VVAIDISSFTQKAYLIEDLDYEQFVTTGIPLTDDWEQAYKGVREGVVLATDDVGSGYFIEEQEGEWIIIKDFKPTDNIITKFEDKEFIIKCMEAKRVDLENEFLEAKKHWTSKKFEKNVNL
jgi:hypothetical protein